VLDQGEIVEEGSHAQLMEKNGIFAHMVETQTRLAR
jgi:ABC-type multidrug transport system fused ATPase/permease subunit